MLYAVKAADIFAIRFNHFLILDLLLTCCLKFEPFQVSTNLDKAYFLLKFFSIWLNQRLRDLNDVRLWKNCHL